MYLNDARKRYVRWLVAARDLSPHTLRAYEGDLAFFEAHLGARTPVADIDRDSVVSFMEALRQAGHATSSIRRRASSVRGLFRWMVELGELEDDPLMGTRISSGRARKLPRTVSSHDLALLFRGLRSTAALNGDARPQAPLERSHASTTLLAVALMVATGLRVNEVVTVEVTNIDLEDRSMKVLGKGRRERCVFLPGDWLSDLTKAYLATRSMFGVHHPYLLFDVNLGPLSTSAVRRRLAVCAEQAGVASRITPHMLRHTAATQLIEAGIDIRIVQRLLGHASLSTTEIYAHVTDRTLRGAVLKADVLGRFVLA